MRKRGWKKAVEKFFASSAADKILFLEAAFWLGVASLLIFRAPFKRVAPYLGVHMKVTSFSDDPERRTTAVAIRRAIKRASRYTPWETKCLAEAIAANKMLDLRKKDSTLYLGLAKNNGELNAHAWLRSGDMYVCGGRIRNEFTIISTFAKTNAPRSLTVYTQDMDTYRPAAEVPADNRSGSLGRRSIFQ